ncbi:uncharacterized protein LOC118998164 [Sturnira hondurensis]|uniref:uncharacterized protein LOC118998164 n=1 Tax=Sturnira hondurensis TaxID=192404 RepID=UPI0018799814|nr:uncharacterized protein LOC118998164 [Sturnira hondurensis]
MPEATPEEEPDSPALQASEGAVPWAFPFGAPLARSTSPRGIRMPLTPRSSQCSRCPISCPIAAPDGGGALRPALLLPAGRPLPLPFWALGPISLRSPGRPPVPKAMALAWPGPAPAWPDLERRAGRASWSLREKRGQRTSEPVLLGPQLCLAQRHSGTWGNRCGQAAAAVPSLTLNRLRVIFKVSPALRSLRAMLPSAQHPAPPSHLLGSRLSSLPCQTVGAPWAVGWLRGHALLSLRIGMDFVAGARALERGLVLPAPAAPSPLQPELHLLQLVLPAGRSSWGPGLGRTALGRGSGVGGPARPGLRCCGQRGGVSE